ncbi:unnamed protein product [Phytomonas sp. Hart1]|nr:unnamed protein product [Phytomonas sp. Hart1]|eukprot:CCW68067.1 unnamed protein product [Phytomonas sp. isolate Hart1]
MQDRCTNHGVGFPLTQAISVLVISPTASGAALSTAVCVSPTSNRKRLGLKPNLRSFSFKNPKLTSQGKLPGFTKVSRTSPTLVELESMLELVVVVGAAWKEAERSPRRGFTVGEGMRIEPK